MNEYTSLIESFLIIIATAAVGFIIFAGLLTSIIYAVSLIWRDK